MVCRRKTERQVRYGQQNESNCAVCRDYACERSDGFTTGSSNWPCVVGKQSDWPGMVGKQSDWPGVDCGTTAATASPAATASASSTPAAAA